MTTPPPAPDELDDNLSYADAVIELEAILRELEEDRIDVDALAARVKRAAELLRFCRERIAGAKLEIQQVVTDLRAFDELATDLEPDDTPLTGSDG